MADEERAQDQGNISIAQLAFQWQYQREAEPSQDSDELRAKYLGYVGFFVYELTNRVNGMQYIGCTMSRLEKRWRGHLSSMTQRRSVWKPLYQDMLKYGPEQFLMELITECPSKFQMRQEETKLIWQRNTIWPNGYNLDSGRLRDLTSYLTISRTLDNVY